MASTTTTRPDGGSGGADAAPRVYVVLDGYDGLRAVAGTLRDAESWMADAPSPLLRRGGRARHSATGVRIASGPVVVDGADRGGSPKYTDVGERSREWQAAAAAEAAARMGAPLDASAPADRDTVAAAVRLVQRLQYNSPRGIAAHPTLRAAVAAAEAVLASYTLGGSLPPATRSQRGVDAACHALDVARRLLAPSSAPPA
jgi:hypothetical protein